MKAWLAGLLLAGSTLARAATWQVGLIGDVPYSAYERRELPKMMSAMADAGVAFIAHIGDIKHGGERCDDSVFQDRLALFQDSLVPFVYVPGDNEWTDCHRLSNGAYDPLERLARLRALFFGDDRSLGREKLRLERQPGAYPENARFRLGPVLFVTLNLPGGDNNAGMSGPPGAEFLARNPAVLAWTREGFALARREQLKGVVLLFQADPGFKHFAEGYGHRGFRDFLELLRRETQAFPGQVVAVHGDTHISRIDHPLRDDNGRPLSNFTRVETFGYPLMGWTRAVIDSESPELLHFDLHPWPPRFE